jgi:hypothetical protein
MVFRRGEDDLPRGNVTLFAKMVYHDGRELLYQRNMRILAKGTNREVLDLQEWLANRVEGLPVKKIEKTVQRAATFILTMPDGTTRELLPPTPVGSGSSPAAASEEDPIILGDLVSVRS